MHKIIILGTALLFLLVSCQNEDTISVELAKASLEQITNLQEIPALLPRSEGIQVGTEWENVQNQYAAFRTKALKGDQEAILNLAQLFTLEARVTGEHGHYYPAALELINDVLSQPIEDKDIRFQLLSTKASVLLSQHDFSDALRVAQLAVNINPYNAQIYGALVDAYVELGNYEKAVAAADKMVAIRPDLRSYARVSYLREIHGDIKGATEAMEQAATAGYPGTEETAWTYLELGNLYARYGKTEQAKKVFEQILLDRPNYPFAIAALADLDIEKKNYKAAEKRLLEAAAIIPEVGFYEQLAQVYQATNRTDELETSLTEIFEMLQDDIDSGHNMNLEFAAIHRDLTKDYNKALSYALEENEKRPDNIDTNRMLAAIYLKQKNTVAANKHLQIALKTNAKFPTLLALQQAL